MAKFKFAADRQRVIDGGPWLFSGHLVIFKAWIPDTPLQCYSFLTCPFWVHVLGIPIEWCSDDIDEVIPETPPPSLPLVVAPPHFDQDNRGILPVPDLPPFNKDAASTQPPVII